MSRIPIQAEHPCIFCCEESVGRFRLDQGCLCFPEPGEQDLCLHHALSANPHGSMELVADYTRDKLLERGTLLEAMA